MFQTFANPWMLFALGGVALPILAHLLSRRRFDVVEWGAMQFLNPSKKTRRRLKLEELLLLLLRISVIAALVFAAARPVLPSGWWSGYQSSGSRTVVLVIDGSSSMSRSDGLNSVHQTAIRRANEFLGTLNPEDSVALIDARDQPRTVVESPLRDIETIREKLKALPPPAGACATVEAIEKAIGILGRSSSAAREVVVFTDRQANGWRSDEDARWNRIDDLLRFPAVRPHLWCVDVAPHLGEMTRNIAVGRIGLSREMTVPDFPLRLNAEIRNESAAELQVQVRLMQDGQTLAGEQKTVTISPKSATAVEFSHSIRQEGTHILSVSVEAAGDAISVDNVSHAAIRVASSLPVLLVNGTPAPGPADRDTFFAELAFAPPEQGAPWIQARTVEAGDLRPADLEGAAAAVISNVATLSPEIVVALMEFLRQGNGLLVTTGRNVTPDAFQRSFADTGLLTQLELMRIRESSPAPGNLIHVAPLTIQPGWLDRFRSDPARSFLKASFGAWSQFRTLPFQATTPPSTPVKPNGAAADPQQPPVAQANSQTPAAESPVILAQLSTGDPLLLETRRGDGRILVFSSSLDRTWNDLPAKSDYVPFLHEAIFHVAARGSQRNVSFGEPLVALLSKTAGDTATAPAVPEFVFTHPEQAQLLVPAADQGSRWVGISTASTIPGVYRVSLKEQPQNSHGSDAFVVNYDHDEDVFRTLTKDDHSRLATNDRVRFLNSVEQLSQSMYGDESVTELWAVLMAVFLAFLIGELLLTRRTILRGYGGESLGAPAGV